MPLSTAELWTRYLLLLAVAMVCIMMVPAGS